MPVSFADSHKTFHHLGRSGKDKTVRLVKVLRDWRTTPRISAAKGLIPDKDVQTL